MTTIIHPFPIIDLAGNTIKNIDIPFEIDAEIPGEDGILMTEEGSAAVREARINLLKGTFWLVEYEARNCVVEVFALPEAKRTSGSPRGGSFSLDMGFFAPGQDDLWPINHAKWIRQVYPTPPPPILDQESPLPQKTAESQPL